MRRMFVKLTTIFSLLAVLFMMSCTENQESPVISPDQEQIGAAPPVRAGVEVESIFRVPTGKPGERLTVFVFYERGGKKPPKDDGGGEQCSDPDGNEIYKQIAGLTGWAGYGNTGDGNTCEYNPSFEPDAVKGLASAAVARAVDTWNEAIGASLIDFVGDSLNPPLSPARDNRNVAGWRQLVGKDARRILAATYIWDIGGVIDESDVVYNTSQSWAVNGSITAGSTTCGVDYDVEGIGAHEFGHWISLDHVDNDDATMFGSAKKNELKKQTLTPGDEDGANAVKP